MKPGGTLGVEDRREREMSSREILEWERRRKVSSGERISSLSFAVGGSSGGNSSSTSVR